jgi:hypothetical protein
MKLRFSNTKNVSIEFKAADRDEFVREGLAALRVFRAATQHRVHRGEIHKTISEFENCELHVASQMGVWCGLGNVEPMATESFGRISVFTPFTVRFSYSADSLDDMHRIDAELFDRSADKFWRGAVDAWNHANNLNNFVQEVADKL